MSPAVIIFYFCILLIAFYMERKWICCFHFCFIYFALIRTSVHSKKIPFLSRPFIFFSKKKAPRWKQQILNPCHIWCFKRIFKKKTTALPVFCFLLFFILILYLNTVDPADDLRLLPCLGAISVVPHSPSMAYTSLIDTHSLTRDGCCSRCVRFFDAAASCRLQSRNSVFSPGIQSTVFS